MKVRVTSRVKMRNKGSGWVLGLGLEMVGLEVVVDRRQPDGYG